MKDLAIYQVQGLPKPPNETLSQKQYRVQVPCSYSQPQEADAE